MDLTLQHLLDFDFKSEIDSVIDSHPELGLNAKELSPLDLDDDPFGCCATEIYGCFGSQTCLHGMSGGSNSKFDVDQNSCDSIFVDPKLVIPSDWSIIPIDDVANVEEVYAEWQTVSEVESTEERYIETEPVSTGEHSEFGNYETYTTAQHTGLQLDDLPNFENDAQIYTFTQQQQQFTVEIESTISDKVYPKPAYSYTCLCALAIKNSQSGKLLVTQIYSFIRKHFPYFRTAPKGWKNSVRHNLSHNKTFEKLETVTPGCKNKRSNLWFINPAKAAKMDEELRKKSRKHSHDIRESMSHPEQLEMLLRGEVKFGISFEEDDEDDFMSDFLVVPGAKRRKTLGGEKQAVHVYQPAKRRKTSLPYLTMDALAEE